MHAYQTALILGYGRSGRAAERLLSAEGTAVCVLDESIYDLSELREALADNAFDVCIVSPGFALDHPWLDAARAAGVPLLSELELGWSRFNGCTIAVTGSNGKSTAVKWIAETLTHVGLRTEMGGNYGVPACKVVMDQPDLDFLVLEVSSFQLETVRHFRPNIAVLLNVLPNHLNRHGTMENYRATKARIFARAQGEDACIVPLELLEPVQKDVPGAAGRWITFGAAGADYCYLDGNILRQGKPVMDLAGTLFGNPVLGGCTGAAVTAVIQACGLAAKEAEIAARSFEPLSHRFQKIAEIDGVTYVNDSKATNLAAMQAAVLACGKRVHLIAGGQPKESDFTFVKEILAEHTERIYLIGQASRTMYEAWSKDCSCVECRTLEEALACVRKAVGKGDIVLLSPGCASFDQFGSFEDRGDQFARLVLG